MQVPGPGGARHGRNYAAPVRAPVTEGRPATGTTSGGGCSFLKPRQRGVTYHTRTPAAPRAVGSGRAMRPWTSGGATDLSRTLTREIPEAWRWLSRRAVAGISAGRRCAPGQPTRPWPEGLRRPSALDTSSARGHDPRGWHRPPLIRRRPCLFFSPEAARPAKAPASWSCARKTPACSPAEAVSIERLTNTNCSLGFIPAASEARSL